MFEREGRQLLCVWSLSLRPGPGVCPGSDVHRRLLHRRGLRRRQLSQRLLR